MQLKPMIRDRKTKLTPCVCCQCEIPVGGVYIRTDIQVSCMRGDDIVVIQCTGCNAFRFSETALLSKFNERKAEQKAQRQAAYEARKAASARELL